MKKTIGLIAAIGLFVCSTLPTFGVALPKGFPSEWLSADGLTTSGVDAQGRTIYNLPHFGDFVFDAKNSERIIQMGPLGAFTWIYDAERKFVTLDTDWWGPLHTSLAGSGSKLGVAFPNVISELQGDVAAKAFYKFDVTNKNVVSGKSIYDYRKKVWASAIGAEKSDAQSFYKAAEGAFVQLQKATQELVDIRVELNGTSVDSDSQAVIENFLKRARVQEDRLLSFRNYYSHYHNRLLDSPNWLKATGATNEQVKALQNAWILGNPGATTPRRSLADLQKDVLVVFSQGLTAFEQFTVVYDSKRAEVNGGSTGGDSGGSTGGDTGGDSGGSSGGSTGNGGTPVDGGDFPVQGDDYSAPGDAYNVSNDAIKWGDVVFAGKIGGNSGYDLSRVSTWDVDVTLHGADISLQPDWIHPSDLEWMIMGNFDTNGQDWGGAWWILVPHNGKYYAAPFEGFDLSYTGWYGLANLNWPHWDGDTYDSHTRVLRGSSLDVANTALWGTAEGTPKSGETYGFFVSSDIDGSKGFHRSNIIFKTFP